MKTYVKAFFHPLLLTRYFTTCPKKRLSITDESMKVPHGLKDTTIHTVLLQYVKRKPFIVGSGELIGTNKSSI